MVDGIQFGKDLKELRLSKKYNSTKLSLEVGRAQTYVSQLERGLIKNPDLATCRRLLEILLAS